MSECVGELFKFGPPNDDAEHGECGEPIAHDGVYKVDGHRRPEPARWGEEFQISLAHHV